MTGSSPVAVRWESADLADSGLVHGGDGHTGPHRSAEASVLRELDIAAAAATVTTAMKALTPYQRQCIQLRYLDDLSVQEAAARLGRPIGATKTRFGPASGNEPKLADPFGRYVITTFVKARTLARTRRPGTSPGCPGTSCRTRRTGTSPSCC